ncbi:hypothetical protein VCR14J2_390144 [Vibrio coralliirubri]|nr:hypothetical protein VCR14J2_390144 [Vibrio coralliirubri]
MSMRYAASNHNKSALKHNKKHRSNQRKRALALKNGMLVITERYF